MRVGYLPRFLDKGKSILSLFPRFATFVVPSSQQLGYSFSKVVSNKVRFNHAPMSVRTSPRIFSKSIVLPCAVSTATAFAAGPGSPMPPLPTSTGPFACATRSAAGPGSPMPPLPTSKGTFFGATLIAAGPGSPMPPLPTSKGTFVGATLIAPRVLAFAADASASYVRQGARSLARL